MSILGTRVIRTEDPRLLTAGGVYVDDLREPELAGAVRATFVRSTVAHALITGIDASEALAQPGVVAVLTAADMTDMPPPPPAEEPPPDAPPAEGPMPLGGKWSEPLLAVDRVRFVGEPVAIVLTESTYQGEDAAELVSVDYEQLPAVPSIEAALAAESLLFPDAGTNVCTQGRGEISDESIFDGCDVIVEGDVVNQRVACLPMEGRSTAAAFVNGKLTVWASYAERPDRAPDPDRHRAAARRDPGGRAGRGRRVRRQDRRRPGVDRRRVGGQAHRQAGALGGDPQREPAVDDAGPRPASTTSRSAAAATGTSRPTGSTSSRTPARTRG